MKIIAAIVTYNRLALLKECMSALHTQTVPLSNIVVINNGSTDGTAEWLKEQKRIHTVNQENLGGSDGFSKGIKIACQMGADWVWVMDDDTVPDSRALEFLIKPLNKEPVSNIGYLCSHVEWTDGSPHLMNVPDVHLFHKDGRPFTSMARDGNIIVWACSFVSVLISTEAVRKVGLPYKEFYIWGDDAEYTERMTLAGFLGVYVPTSIVTHKTAVNYSSNIYKDDDKSLWKYKYGIRNALFMVKQKKGLGGYIPKLLKQLFIVPLRMLRKRKDHKWAFIKINWEAALSSIFFSAKKEMP